MICIKCKRRLKADAVACLCGWSDSPTVPTALVQCSRPGNCDRPTDCRATCLWRWEHQYQPAAIAYAKRNDLRTAKDHIEHCKEMAKGFGKVWGRERMVAHWKKMAAESKSDYARDMAVNALGNLRAEREPGEDDEELAA